MRDMRLFVLHLQIFFEHTLFKGLVCAYTISVHTIIKNNTTGFKNMFIGLNKQSKVTTCNYF